MHRFVKDGGFALLVGGFCVVLAVALAGPPAAAAPQLPALAGAPSEGEVVPAVLGVGGSGLAESADLEWSGIATASLNLRKGPATSYERVALLREGRPLQVLREDNEWLYVTSADQVGWVHRDYVELTPGSVGAADLRSEVARLREGSEAWQAERVGLERRIAKLETDRADLQLALRDLRGEVDFGGDPGSDDSSGGGDSEGLGRREAEGAAALAARIDALELERSDLRAALEASQGELDARIAAATEERLAVESALAAARDEVAGLRRALAEPTTSPEATAALESLRGQLDTVRSQMESELAASEQARESLWAHLASVREENAALKHRLGLSGGLNEMSTIPLAQPIPYPREESSEELAQDSSTDEADALRQQVAAWATAWSDQSLQLYLSFYSADFEPEDGSRDAWRSLRERRLSGPEFITVEVGEVSVDAGGDGRATTTFLQSYSSNRYADRVEKTLEWALESGTWRIVREQSEPRP